MYVLDINFLQFENNKAKRITGANSEIQEKRKSTIYYVGCLLKNYW